MDGSKLNSCFDHLMLAADGLSAQMTWEFVDAPGR